MAKNLKTKKDFLIDLTRKYANDFMECVHFFFEPTGFYCEKCECTHYYFIKRGNISQCRILMSNSISEKILDSMFYEADVAYIGSKSKESHKQGVATEQQPFLVILSTDKENKYPGFIKLFPVSGDNSSNIERFIIKSIVMSQERILNTDGKTTFYTLKDRIHLQSEKILYTENEHRPYWLNTIVGDIKNNITGIYHGVAKRDLPLFLNEQEWRFNHRNTGYHIMEKVRKYLFNSYPCPRRAIVTVLNLSESYFNTCI